MSDPSPNSQIGRLAPAFALVLGLLGLGLFFAFDRPSAPELESREPFEAPPEVRTGPSNEPVQPREPAAPRRDVRSSAAAAGPSKEALEQATRLRTETKCATDEDCRGPRTADCVQARCIEGQCALDERGCECRENDECDDGRACTRDLCFARTKRCIHIDSDCPK